MTIFKGEMQVNLCTFSRLKGSFKIILLCGVAILFTASSVFAQQTAAGYLDIGSKQAEQKNYDAAIAAYSECINLAPNQANCYWQRALAYTDVVMQNPDPDAIYRADGISVKNSSYQKAIEDLNKTLQLDPQSAVTILYLRGSIFYAEFIFDRAASDYRQALSSDLRFSAKNPDLYKLLTNAVAKAESGYAQFPLTRAVKATKDAELLFAQGNVEEAGKLYKEAVWRYSEAAARGKATPEILLGRGYAYKRLENHPKALADFSQVIKLNAGRINADSALALINRAEIYEAQNNAAFALADYEQVIAQAANKELEIYVKNAVIARAKIRVNNNQPDAAIDDYTNLLAENPAASEIYYLRGLAYLRKEDKIQAANDFKKALELNPDYREAKTQLDNFENNKSAVQQN